MLVLTRRQGDRIVVDDKLVITVLRAGGQIKLGFEAPNEVKVVRAELTNGQDVEIQQRLKDAG